MWEESMLCSYDSLDDCVFLSTSCRSIFFPLIFFCVPILLLLLILTVHLLSTSSKHSFYRFSLFSFFSFFSYSLIYLSFFLFFSLFHFFLVSLSQFSFFTLLSFLFFSLISHLYNAQSQLSVYDPQEPGPVIPEVSILDI